MLPVAGARELPCANACSHATFVAGILHARRGSAAPTICPGLHPAGSPRLRGDGLRRCRDAERSTGGACCRDPGLPDSRCQHIELESGHYLPVGFRGACGGGRARRGRTSRRARRRCGRQPGDRREFDADPPSVGHSGSGLRSGRPADAALESGRLDRPTGSSRARR